MRARAIRWVMICAAVVMLPASGAIASQGNVRAVMIYNILRFLSLPEPHAKLRLCLRRSEDIAADLLALAGEPVGPAKLEVVLVGGPAEMGRGCDAIYLGASPVSTVGAPGRGQVLIGDGMRFVEDGGTVGLVSFGGQVRIAINAGSASRSGVKVSSQLMRLAARIVN